MITSAPNCGAALRAKGFLGRPVPGTLPGNTFWKRLSNVNIGSRRGVWGTRVSPRPRPAGAWGTRVSPCPHPREGLGGRSPPRNNRMFIAALCGGAAWTANVNIDCWSRGVGKPGFPTPLPAGGPRPHAGGWGNRVSPSPHPGPVSRRTVTRVNQPEIQNLPSKMV